MSKYPLNFIMYDDVNKLCRDTGMAQKLMRKELIELKDLERVLDKAIKEAESAIDEHTFWRNMETGARIVVVISEIALLILGGGLQKGVSFAFNSIKGLTDIIVSAFNKNLSSTAAFKYSTQTKMDALEIVKDGTKFGDTVKLANKVLGILGILDTIRENYSEWEKGSNGDSGLQNMRRQSLKEMKKVRAEISELEHLLSASN